jgi:hypothetical protein
VQTILIILQPPLLPYKRVQEDGMLVDDKNAEWRRLQQFKFNKFKHVEYQMSTEGARLGRLLEHLSDQYLAVTEEDSTAGLIEKHFNH